MVKWYQLMMSHSREDEAVNIFLVFTLMSVWGEGGERSLLRPDSHTFYLLRAQYDQLPVSETLCRCALHFLEQWSSIIFNNLNLTSLLSMIQSLITAVRLWCNCSEELSSSVVSRPRQWYQVTSYTVLCQDDATTVSEWVSGVCWDAAAEF